MTSFTAQPKSRIVVVDDHPLVRERLVELIDREPDLETCGEAEDRFGALEMIALTRPDLAIVDLGLKSSLGIELIKDLEIQHPSVLILVVSMQDELVHAERCLKAGAKGYIEKQQASRHILQAIHKVLAGELYLSEKLTRHLLSKNLGRRQPDTRSSDDALLTDRELQVYERIGTGMSTRQIAEALSIDVKTIETYRARIREKLGIKDPSELLKHAIAWKHRNG